MREIKFRAWIEVLEKMFDWEAVQMCCGMRMFGRQESEGVFLMQFTGLKDKNGREIYEGDIVKAGNSTWTVIYYERDCAFRLGACLEGHVGSAGLTKGIEIKVIGNIYENPELIKEASR